ncbi:MAG: magnesium transporter [Defluviitaleaceae bacterium]|nr:magnesium transporter [Defluviitaleaceae bacterium]
MQNAYDQIMEFLKQKNMNELKSFLNDSNEVDILDAIQSLSAKNQCIAYRLLSKDKALYVFEQLDTDDQQNLLRSFTDEQAIELVNELAPDDRVKLFDEMPAAVAKKMLAMISPKEREMTNLLMGYEPRTAGRIMTPEYVRLFKGMTADKALEKVKSNAEEKETIYTLYITDDKRKLEGVLSLRDLLIAKPDVTIESIMEETTAVVTTDTDQEEVARLLQKLDWLAVPVVDKENRIVGIVTIDDAVDILEDETTEDLFIQAGIVASDEANRSETLISGSLWAIWKVRLPFLVITILAGMFAAVVMRGFEDVLAATVAVAFFMPLVMDMGGNVGAQSSTIFVRGVALGQIQMAQFWKHFFKEFSVGASIGIASGIVSGLFAYTMSSLFWEGVPMLGVAVGLSVAATITLAAVLGFLIPYILMKLNVDQAAGSAPIITSIKDISGLLIYFGFVALFLGGGA